MADLADAVLKCSWTFAVLAQTCYIFLECAVTSLGFAGKKGRDCQKCERQDESLVLFFPDKRLVCKKYFSQEGCRRKECPFSHEETSLSKLISVLSRARTSLDVCVFTINCHELANSVVHLHKKGVVVRILTDNEQIGSHGSQIEKFRREGIQVRHDLSSFFMHHKFVIVDNETLINGSFNWTRQAVTGNRENVMILNNCGVVGSFHKEFEKLWIEYDPSRR